MSLSCFIYTPSTSIPIFPISESDLSVWLKAQAPRVQNWADSVAFRAKPGSVGLICNPDGQLEKVLVGVADDADNLVFGQLPNALPKGHYHIESTRTAEQLYPAYLAWGLGSYQFTTYKKAAALETKLVLPASDTYLTATLEATYLVRDLINTPAENMMPQDLAARAEALATQHNATVHITSGDELLQQGYAAIHTVGRASKQVPCLIDLRWGNSKHPKVTLVGKGVCFDSGGLDIKGAANMATMKKDMGGAAHVLGLAHIVMSLQLPIQLRVLVPAVENAVSGNSYRPGDIITTRPGKTVEITNTDAEGRLVLCEALDEAARDQPEVVIDFATLTGAARVAMGTEIGALFTPDDALAQQLQAASQLENDPIWRLPLHKPYRKLIEGKIADLVNSAAAPYGGAITAALFLQDFVPKEQCWAHFDIMAWNLSSKPGAPEGGEANGLRAVARYLLTRFK